MKRDPVELVRSASSALRLAEKGTPGDRVTQHRAAAVALRLATKDALASLNKVERVTFTARLVWIAASVLAEALSPDDADDVLDQLSETVHTGGVAEAALNRSNH